MLRETRSRLTLRSPDGIPLTLGKADIRSREPGARECPKAEQNPRSATCATWSSSWRRCGRDYLNRAARAVSAGSRSS